MRNTFVQLHWYSIRMKSNEDNKTWISNILVWNNLCLKQVYCCLTFVCVYRYLCTICGCFLTSFFNRLKCLITVAFSNPVSNVFNSQYSSSQDTTVQNLVFTCQTTDTTRFAVLFHYNVIYEMNFTLCVLLVYNDNEYVQTLCIKRVLYKVFAQTHCHYKPTIHKGWNSFYIFTLFSCVLIFLIDRYRGNGCVSLENPTVCTVNGRA